MRSMLLRWLNHRIPVNVFLARKAIQAFSLFSYEDRLKVCATDRPHYGHCLFEAAKLAARLKYPKISAIEFGCGGGNGLLSAETHIMELEKLFPIKFELYGFDSGKGLPVAKDYRDFPYYFNSGQFKMEVDQLRSTLRRAEIVVGNVSDTCKTFFDKYNPAPVGCIFNDLDYYSSTKDSFNIFDAENRYFLPRVFMYFDDIIGDNTWLSSEFAGELLAIEEFNLNNSSRKIAANRAMPASYPDQWWAYQIYIYHDFQHPRYNVFVASEEQRLHEAFIRLRMKRPPNVHRPLHVGQSPPSEEQGAVDP
jgi:hypothetical protein